MNIQGETAQKIAPSVVVVAINAKNHEKVAANDRLVRRGHVLALVELVLRRHLVEIDQGSRFDKSLPVVRDPPEVKS